MDKLPQTYFEYANDVADEIVDRMIEAATGFAPSNIAEARQEQRRRMRHAIAILIENMVRQ